MKTPANRRRPEARPSEILAAALDLFSERGFTATRLEDVAARAGLSKAAIYLYFKDKSSLLNAIVQETAVTNVDHIRVIAAAHTGPVAPLLRQVLEILADRIRNSHLPQLIKLVIAESRAHPEIGRQYLENVIGRAMPTVQSLIERGIANGEFRAVDPSLTVRCLIAPMLLAAIWRGVFEPIGAPPVDASGLARLHADLIIRGLTPEKVI
jgi:AcrR family transcriptional regulator